MTRDQLRRAYLRGEPFAVLAVHLGLSMQGARLRCLRWFGERHQGTVRLAQRNRRGERLRRYWLERGS